MATTLQDISDLLHDDGVVPFSDGMNSLICTYPHQGQLLMIHIHLMEDGGYLRYRVPYYLNLQRTPHRALVLEKLLAINYDIKLLKFGVDPEDGEVSVEVNLLLGDADPPAAQVRRYLYCLTGPAMGFRDRLLTLIETGVYPASEDAAFCAALEHLIPDTEETEVEADKAEESAGDRTDSRRA